MVMRASSDNQGDNHGVKDEKEVKVQVVMIVLAMSWM